MSLNRSTIYSAGGDGSIMAWTYGGKPNPNQPIHSNTNDPVLASLPLVERCAVSKIKLFTQLLREEFMAREEAKKQQFRGVMLEELEQIKAKLMDLLEENERVTDIERLDRDEFIIDEKRMENVVNEGVKESEEIRKEAEKTVLRLELLRERVMESTWNTMQTQQTAIKSIQGDTLIFNYPVRKRLPQELRRLDQIKTMRVIELREKMKRLESQLRESLDEEEFTKLEEDYMMNRLRGRPDFVEDESI
jgi:hypothetical protein